MSVETILSCDSCSKTEGYRERIESFCEKCLDERLEKSFNEGVEEGRRLEKEEAEKGLET